jgi:outer membrane protein insertion porin family
LRLLAFLLIAGVLVAPAQTRRTRKPAATATTPLNPDSWPIQSISIEGNQNFTREQVLGIAKVRVGQIASKAELEAAHERLMSSGVFDRVAYRYAPTKDGKGVTVTFEVAEVMALYPIMFEDMPVDEAKLRAWLKQKDPLFGPKISATKESLAHYSQLVGEYIKSEVTARLSSENPPDLIILIRPATARPVVAQVTARNTGDIVAGVVQSTLYGVAVGTVYSEPRIRQLLDSSVRPLYDAKGHVRVTFPKIEGEPAKDVKGVAVTVQVEQGPIFNLGKITFAGMSNEEDEMQNLAKLKSGTLANFDEVKAAQARIVDYFKHIGYLRASTEALRKVHDAEKTVDVTIQITTGPQFIFHQLTIVGLDIESEPVIRKLWGLKEGKPFNPDYPDHFLERVKEQGLFDNLKNTSSERKVNNDDHTVDVTLTFK